MIKLAFDTTNLIGDLALGATGLEDDDSLQTCVLISLFTDRRAQPDDPLPAGAGSDRRGFAGDALAEIDGDLYGSRLWLLKREKQTEETRKRAIAYAQEALAWLIDEQLATRVDVDAQWAPDRRGLLGLAITIYRTNGTAEVVPVSFAVIANDNDPSPYGMAA